MTKEDLRDIASAIRDLRFIQASALVGASLTDSKEAKKYMARLAQLQELTDKEAMK